MTRARRALPLLAASLAIGAIAVLALDGRLRAQTPATQAELLLGKALSLEEVSGKLKEAIAAYRQVLAAPDATRAQKARAQFRIGACYERLGEAEARKAYEIVVKEYGDQREFAAQAKARLARLQPAAATAGPFAVRSLDALTKNLGTVYLSPDGRFYAYARKGANGGEALCVRSLTTGHERVLAGPKAGSEWISGFTWSPDSARIAYVVHANEAPSELRVTTLSGGEPRMIFRAEPADAAPRPHRWSPDGSRLAFGVTTRIQDASSDSSSFWRVDLRISTAGLADSQVIGTVTRAATAGIALPVWAPDSRTLAWVGRNDSTQAEEIRAITVATRENRSLELPAPAKGGTTTLTAWTPRNEFFFSQSVPGRGNDYFLMPAGAGPARRICEGRGVSGGDGCTDLSPDGTLLVTRKNEEGGGRTVLRNVITGEERPLTTASVMENPAGVGFSPDGRLIGFSSRRDGKWGFYVVPVSEIPVASPLLIMALDSSAMDPQGWWTPAGLVVKVTHSESNIFRLDVDPKTGRPVGTPQRLTQETERNTSPEISPDGRRIAYMATGPKRSGFAVIDATGARERTVGDEVPADLFRRIVMLGWRSPDEILLADPTARNGRSPGFKTLDARTGELSDLQPFPPDLPRTDTIIQSTMFRIPSRPDVFYSPSIDGKQQWDRYRSTFGTEIKLLQDAIWGPVVSADGCYLAYSYIPPPPDAKPCKMCPLGIRLKPLDGGAERDLVPPVEDDWLSVAPKAFSPDGRFLLYLDEKRQLRIVNTETAESRPFMNGTQGDVSFESTDVSWSPDGSFIALTGETGRIERKIFEGVTHDALVRLIKSSRK